MPKALDHRFAMARPASSKQLRTECSEEFTQLLLLVRLLALPTAPASSVPERTLIADFALFQTAAVLFLTLLLLELCPPL